MCGLTVMCGKERAKPQAKPKTQVKPKLQPMLAKRAIAGGAASTVRTARVNAAFVCAV